MEYFDLIDRFHANFPALSQYLLKVNINWTNRGKCILRTEAIEIFKRMIDVMLYWEVKINFEECLSCWAWILKEHFKGFADFPLLVVELNSAFNQFVDTVNVVCLDKVTKFQNLLSVSAIALDVDIDSVLRIYESTETLKDYRAKLLYDSKHRFSTLHANESKLLFQDFERLRPMAEILIKRGFGYYYDYDYFISSCLNVIHHPKFLIKGEKLSFDSRIRRNGNLRLQLALELLLALFITDQDIDPSAAYHNLKRETMLLWRAMPFPYITEEEMHQLLEPYYLKRTLSLKDVCSEYVKSNDIFEVPEKKEPRTLQHLARVQIRRQLTQTQTISDERIEKLFLPKSIKEYIKLEF